MSDTSEGPRDLPKGARFHSRHPARFRLVFDDGATYSVGRVENISTTGVFMETGEPIPVGAIVRLEPVEPGEEALADLLGRVVRCDELDPTSVRATDHDGAYGIALELIDVDSERSRAIEALITRLEQQAAEKDDRDPYTDFIDR